MPRRSSLSLPPPRLPLPSLFLLSFTVPIATGDVLLGSSFKPSSSLKLLSPHSQATRHMPLPQDDRNICPKTTASHLAIPISSRSISAFPMAILSSVKSLVKTPVLCPVQVASPGYSKVSLFFQCHRR
ncbi:hypothetical protein B0H19DRAFT_1159981, partial [Mycena capillaripes]